MKTLKFAVIGNCQARPVSSIINHLVGSDVNNTEIIISHLSKESDLDRHVTQLSSVDIIFAQKVYPKFQASHLITDNLIQMFGDKVIVWPNLFFIGNSPGLCYLTNDKGARITGPLGDYQFKEIYECWKKELSLTESINFLNYLYDPQNIAHSVSDSLDNLKKRELDTFVSIADFIEERWNEVQLFFTFNHPVSLLMIELCKRMLKVANIQYLNNITSPLIGEPLGKIIPPVLNLDSKLLGLKYDTTQSSKGHSLNIKNGALVMGPSKVYSLEDLVASSYMALNHQKILMDNVRLSPKFNDL
jgi:hypothetical protein